MAKRTSQAGLLDGTGTFAVEDFSQEEDVGCMSKCAQCPGKCCHFLSHSNKSDGHRYWCLLTCTTWFQLSVFLVALWIVSGLFWWGMFELVVLWPTKALWAFLIAFALFTVLFIILMSIDMEDDDTDIKTMGCTEKELKDHIDRIKKPDMFWHEFGYKWHITHRTPLHEDNPSAEADARVVQICQRMHFTNTVPVWAADLQPVVRIKKTAHPYDSNNDEEREVKNTAASTGVKIHLGNLAGIS